MKEQENQQTAISEKRALCINKISNKIFFFPLQVPTMMLVIEKSTPGDVDLQYQEHAQRIMTFGYISWLLLSKNCPENEFSVLS